MSKNNIHVAKEVNVTIKFNSEHHQVKIDYDLLFVKRQIFPVKHIKKRGESLVVMVIVNQFIKNVCLYDI